MRHRIPKRALLAFLLSICLGVCAVFPEALHARKKEKEKATMSDVELRSRLQASFERFSMRMVRAVDRIKADCPDLSVRRRAVYWMSLAVPDYGGMIMRPDPRVALFDVLAFTTAMRKSFTVGQGKDLFGPCQPIAVETAINAEEDALGIARLLLGPRDLETVRQEVDEWVAENKPFNAYGQSRVEQQEQLTEKKRPSSLMSISLSAINLFKEIDNATHAVNEMNRVGERIAQIAENSPQYGRWAMELLFYDLLETEQVASLLQSLDSVSRSFSRLLDMGDKLPEEARTEVDKILRELDRQRRGLEGLMQEGRLMIREADAALGKADSLAGKYDAFIDKCMAFSTDVDTNTRMLSQASTDWNQTIDKALGLNEKTMASARAVSDAAGQMDRTMDKAGKLMENDAFEDILDNTKGLSDHLFLRAGLLILFFFAVLFVYRLAAARFLSRSGRPGP